MKLILKSIEFQKGGVYQIICLKNNRVYYGQTCCFLRRCKQHIEKLKKHQHSKLLQNDFDLFGIDNFRFEILIIEQNEKKRRKLETNYVKKTVFSQLYNKISSTLESRNIINSSDPQHKLCDINLFDFDKAGVYKITCIATQKVYYGQTVSFLKRWTDHVYHLQKHTHECLKLQKDFNVYGPENVIFQSLCLESDNQERLNIEQIFIKKTLLKNLYNAMKPHNFTQRATRHCVNINNKTYNSISDASRQLNLAVLTLRKKLDDPTNQNYYRLEIIQVTNFDRYEVLINGKHFNSTSDVVKASLAKSTKQVRERCRSKKWKNWHLIQKKV